MSWTGEEARTALSGSPEESHRQQTAWVLRERYKWRILASTSIISVILAGIFPSLGILLYYDLKDKQVPLRAAIRTPIYFIVSWCLADSWSQTAYTTTNFRKIAVATSITTAISIMVNFAFHDTLESIGSQYLLGIVAGGGTRLLMTTSENMFSDYFSTRSALAMGLRLLTAHTVGFLLVPSLVAFVAETEGIHYGILALGALVLQILPAVMLLRKPQPVHSSRRLYLTTQPAYALLHNENDESDEHPEEEETSLHQLNYGAIPSPQHTHDAISPGIQIQPKVNAPEVASEATDNTVVPLFTDIDLVAGTYQGEVAFSFEDTTISESPRYDRSELFFHTMARQRRNNEQMHQSRCCALPIASALNQELNHFKQPALYLGLISIIAQISNSIATLILLPTLTSGFPTLHSNLEVPSEAAAAFVSIIIGIASIPVILVPFTFNYFSHSGRKLTYGVSTAMAAVFVYGIGKRLPEFPIISLICFGLSDAISIGTFEQFLKKILLGNYPFKGHKNYQEEWGKIRGLANTVVGLIVLLTSIAVDILIEDTIDWPLLYYMTGAIQMFAGIAWIVTPTKPCQCIS
ncbi:uncharacterized protein LOC124158060 [Ischnura elegans]|uniref:uncharacterized protein LOC124158060 n=1 Tax=Ischnura elegans TaxID=197161 RepID=UPI001ED87073|nr:uncharacterized protein LOC124158060 [Ischnura elegans]